MPLMGNKLAGGNPKRGRVENDYYATPFRATNAILDQLPDLSLDDVILEPAAGEGHIVKCLKERYPYTTIIANDIAYRSSRFGIDVNGGIDFLNPTLSYSRPIDTIITNPPFSLAQEFIEKALSITKHYVIILAKIQLLEGEKRRSMFDNTPLKYIYVFSKRVSTLWNGQEVDENGKPWATTMCLAWYVWEIGYEGEPIVRWL